MDKVFALGTVFGETYKVLEKSAYTSDQLLEYTRYELKEEEIETHIYDAKVEDIKEGTKEGRKEEIEKVHQEKIESTKKMLRKGLSLFDVADLIGISVEKIKELK